MSTNRYSSRRFCFLFLGLLSILCFIMYTHIDSKSLEYYDEAHKDDIGIYNIFEELLVLQF